MRVDSYEDENKTENNYRMRLTQNCNREGSSVQIGFHQEQQVYGEGPSVKSNDAAFGRNIYEKDTHEQNVYRRGLGSMAFSGQNMYGEGSSTQNTHVERNIYGEGLSTQSETYASQENRLGRNIFRELSLNRAAPQDLNIYGEGSSSQNKTTAEARNIYGEGSSSQNKTTAEARNIYGEGSSSQNKTTAEARNIYGEGSSSQNNTTVEAQNIYEEGSSTNNRITTEEQRNHGEVSSSRIGTNEDALEERSKLTTEAANNALKSLERDGYDGYIPVYGTGTYAVIRALYSEKQV